MAEVDTYTESKALYDRLLKSMGKAIIGQREVIEQILVAILTGNHALLEGYPGLGKTMMIRALAQTLDLDFSRIQCTPDLMPSDITGTYVIEEESHSGKKTFRFQEGPIFSNIVLADEINRATPKVQSALLECMDEKQITVDGVTHKMPRPFHVLATQNPIEYEGTFPLPETELDRFALRISLGYPTEADEVAIMERQQYQHPIETIEPVVSGEQVQNLQKVVRNVYVDELVRQYIASIVNATRNHPSIYLGASPRGSLALFRTAQARALVHGRDYVLPDDIKALAEPVLAHRLIIRMIDTSHDKSGRTVIKELLDTIPVPGAVT